MADPGPAPSPPGIVEPFHFGDPPLYGCLHPGSDRRAEGDGRGVLICSPVGHEYITFHRAARQLATQISRAGSPTLRFDYRGTGDSAGTIEQVRLGDWIADVRAAMDELRRRTGTGRLTLVGVRLGGALALLAAEGREDVDSIALWDPVIWGSAYLKELRRDTRRMQRVAHVLPSPPDGPASRTSGLELVGFEYPEALVDDLRGVELDALKPAPRERFLLLETTAAASAPLGAVLRASGAEVETLTEAIPHAWRWSEDITRVQLPHAQVRAVARWVRGG